jgi:hypothetical protein
MTGVKQIPWFAAIPLNKAQLPKRAFPSQEHRLSVF